MEQKKYCRMLAKIKADDAWKRALIARLETQPQAQTRRAAGGRRRRTGWAALAAAALALLACTGAAVAVLHAGFGAKHDGVQFSADYPQYVEPVTGQTAGDPAVTPPTDRAAAAPAMTEAEKLEMQVSGDGVQVALESYLCDEGFLDLQFRVKLSAEKLAAFRSGEDDDWEEPLTYLSFNDPVTEENGVRSVRLGGANYSLILDGRELWLRGRTARSVEKVGVGEYVIQQMWFLGEDAGDSFRVTLGDVAVGLGERCIPLEGGFDLTVSREKAAAATRVVPLAENAWSPRAGVTKTVERVSQTPLQTIFRIRSVYTGVSSEHLDVDAWGYLVYDAAGEARATYSARVSAEITYDDGVTERLADPGEYDFSRDGREGFENATFVTEEIVAAAPVEGRVTLRAYESDYAPDYRMTAAAEFRVDLDAGAVEAEALRAVLYDAGTGEMNDEFRTYYRQRYGQEADEVLGSQPLPEDWLLSDRDAFVSELD